MVIRFQQRAIFSILTIAVVFFATAFVSFGGLIEAQLLSKSWAFVAGAIVCCAIGLFFRKDIRLSGDIATLLVLLLAGYILLRMGLAGRFDLKFLLAAAFMSMFLFFKTVGNKYNDAIAIIIVLVCVSQAVYGLLQYAGVVYSGGGFRMMGSFDNPAGIAALLSAGLPFCFSLTAWTNRWKYAGWVSFAVITVAIVLSCSRTGMIAATAVTGLFFVDRYKAFFKRHKSVFIVSAVVFCILAGAGLFYLKKDSAVGRLLIWETSARMIQDKPLFGHGPGAFMADYMDWQADYFESHPDSKYSQLANNVAHPFNEYILLTVEYSLVGLAILIALTVLILVSVRKISPALLCLLSTAIFACFSYPTRYACVLMLLAYSLANLDLPEIKQFRLNLAGRIAGIIAMALLTFGLVRDIRFESRWGKLVHKNSLGRTSELLGDYARLHDGWNGNPLFLYNYGAMLNVSKDYPNSNTIMSECKAYYNDYDVQMLIADNYHNLSEWDKSLDHYRLASRMCPNRFMPLYKMTLVYDAMGQEEKSRELAEIIIHKEVKIPSMTVNRIKESMRNKLYESEK